MEVSEMDWADSGKGEVAGAFERGNEISGTIKRG
jgi:hypothetical protein